MCGNAGGDKLPPEIAALQAEDARLHGLPLFSPYLELDEPGLTLLHPRRAS